MIAGFLMGLSLGFLLSDLFIEHLIVDHFKLKKITLETSLDDIFNQLKRIDSESSTLKIAQGLCIN